jgi:PhzF family phenazine biosynthesis protein
MTPPIKERLMTSLPFTQVDAFADAPFTGNPAAVMPLGRWLDDATLQAIAAENNLSETAFTVPTPDDPETDYALRWFTPAWRVRKRTAVRPPISTWPLANVAWPQSFTSTAGVNQRKA